MKVPRILIPILLYVGSLQAFSLNYTPSRTKSHLKANKLNDNGNNSNNDEKQHSTNSNIASRREVIATTAALLGTNLLPTSANAFNLPFQGASSTSTVIAPSGYKQAKRATAYLVDSTMPPTIVPFRASREAAILKQIGSGIGTQKTPFLEEGLNLNNFMKKGVYGTIDAVTSVLSPSVSQSKGPTFCFLALPEFSSGRGEDVELAESIITDLFKPRRANLSTDTSVGIAFLPKLSGQPILDQYQKDGNFDILVQKMTTDAQVPSFVMTHILPLLKFAHQKGVPILALGPERQDLTTVRKDGLQNVDVGRRNEYVLDTDGFINLTQEKRFKLYADRSLLKDWVPLEDPTLTSPSSTSSVEAPVKKDGPGDFFAERILEDEAIATSIAQWAVHRPDSFMVVISDIPHSRFFGGANGRIPRIMKFLNQDSPVEEENVTTILINPTAEVRVLSYLLFHACILYRYSYLFFHSTSF